MKKAKKLGLQTESRRSLKSLSTISLAREPFLEKWARLFRFLKVLPEIEKRVIAKKEFTLIDFGCGQDILLYKFLMGRVVGIKEKLRYIGIDPLLPTDRHKLPINVLVRREKYEWGRNLEMADVITCLAVLEHVDEPEKLLEVMIGRLKKNGVLILTTPTPKSKWFLEFFAYRLGIISKREIDEHKQYPDRNYLLKMMKKLERKNEIEVVHQYFEMGLNNLLVVRRK